MGNDLTLRRQKTKARIRGRLSGTPERPRLTIFKSLKRIYVQAVDDTQGITLAAASSLEKDLRDTLKSGSNIAAAKAVGSSRRRPSQGEGHHRRRLRPQRLCLSRPRQGAG